MGVDRSGSGSRIETSDHFLLESVLAILLLGLLSGVAPLSATTAIASPDPAAGSGLRPIDQTALQALLAKTARELHIPGAVILLRTPQGELTATYGTTQLGSSEPGPARTPISGSRRSPRR